MDKCNASTSSSSFESETAAEEYTVPDHFKIYPDEEFANKALGSATRHPLKCDLNRQLPPAEKDMFNYNKFAQYIQVKFILEENKRADAILKGDVKNVHKLDFYSDNVLKKEVFDLYGVMDETTNRFKLIFENYKEERLEQIKEWMKEEEKLITVIESKEDAKTKSSKTDEIEFELQDCFSVQEIINFDKVSIYHLVQTDVFLLPRPIKTELKVLERYGTSSRLTGLTDFDPHVNLNEIIIPEISDTNVGDKLAMKFMEIVNEHPTGISSNVFLVEFKKRNKYYPSAKDLNYSSYADMMTDLGKHLILIQDFPDNDTAFYFPMSLQGLVVSPKDMFWNILHKLRIALNFYRGIVKVSTAFKFCQNVFGWKPLDFKSWGFDNDYSFLEFLIDHWAKYDNYKIIPETQFKPNGNSNVRYLVYMDKERLEYFNNFNLNVQILQKKQQNPNQNKVYKARQTSILSSEKKSYQIKILGTTRQEEFFSSSTKMSSNPNQLKILGTRQDSISSSNVVQKSLSSVSDDFPLLSNSQPSSSSNKRNLKGNNLSKAQPSSSTKPKTWSSLLKK